MSMRTYMSCLNGPLVPVSNVCCRNTNSVCYTKEFPILHVDSVAISIHFLVVKSFSNALDWTRSFLAHIDRSTGSHLSPKFALQFESVCEIRLWSFQLYLVYVSAITFTLSTIINRYENIDFDISSKWRHIPSILSPFFPLRVSCLFRPRWEFENSGKKYFLDISDELRLPESKKQWRIRISSIWSNLFT